jgi:hypothetical protein
MIFAYLYDLEPGEHRRSIHRSVTKRTVNDIQKFNVLITPTATYSAVHVREDCSVQYRG